MAYGCIIGNIFWDVDPNNAFPGADPELMIELCGIVPTFVNRADENIVETAKARYGFPVGDPFQGGKFSEDGGYTYPGDPILQPLMKADIEERDTVVFIYQHGWVNFRVKGTNHMYRFD